MIEPRIAEHRGRIVKLTGDGALVEFASAVDAVQCAVEVQQSIAEHNVAIKLGRFDTDHMAVTIETYRLHAWQQIPIVELRT